MSKSVPWRTHDAQRKFRYALHLACMKQIEFEHGPFRYTSSGMVPLPPVDFPYHELNTWIYIRDKWADMRGTSTTSIAGYAENFISEDMIKRIESEFRVRDAFEHYGVHRAYDSDVAEAFRALWSVGDFKGAYAYAKQASKIFRPKKS